MEIDDRGTWDGMMVLQDVSCSDELRCYSPKAIWHSE